MTPQEIGQYVGQAVTLIVAVIALASRRVRSPSDDQARIDSGIKILESQLARTEAAQERWLDVEKYLREQLDKADEKDSRQAAEIENLRSLLAKANFQIRELAAERDELLIRIRNLAAKYGRGEPITLADILGEDIEDTYPSVDTALHQKESTS